MPVSTPGTRPLAPLLVALCLLLTVAGCQSARPTYSFQPLTAAVPARPADSAPSGLPVTVAAAAPVATQVPAAAQLRPQRVVRARTVRQQLRRAVAQARVVAAPSQPDRSFRQPKAASGAQAVQEVGLGTTVLGVLGLIVGPIALIGLLIWGGPVWAILAGLAALAVLVAYIDPFR